MTLLRNAQISFASRKRLRHQHTASRFASRSRRKAKRDTRWIVVQPLDDIEFSSDGEASSPEELSDAKPRSSTRLSELAKRKKKRLSSFHSADDAASSEFDTESELDESPVVPLIRPPLVASPPIEQEEEDDGDEEEDEGLPAQDTTQDNDKGAKDEKYRQLELELAALRAQMQAILAGTTPAINVPPSAPKVAAPPPPPPPPPPPRNTEIRVPLPLSRTKRALSTLNEGTVSSPCLILQPQNLDKGRLRRSEVQRSPGGTPVRVVDENSKAPQSTADFIASALKRKFQVRARSRQSVVK